MRSELLLPFAVALATACTWETDLPAEARVIDVVPTRELMVVDDAALARAPGFVDSMERLPLAESGTLRWLSSWSRHLEAESHGDRGAKLAASVTCRWLRASEANACDPACTSCAAHALLSEAAPFRLVAIANRTDLAATPDRAADGGEGRLVFALTDGPAADPRSSTLPLTVIFEYAQAGSALEWSRRWHALGALPDQAFPDALAALVSSFVDLGRLAQIRTADAFTGPLVLSQFEIVSGELVAAPVRNTPDFGRVGRDELRAFAEENGPEIDDGTFVLPRAWWAASSAMAERPPAWVSEVPRHEAILRQTCAGCHAIADTGFQIDPQKTGVSRLSRFLSDETRPSDELRRRADWMRLTLWGGTR